MNDDVVTNTTQDNDISDDDNEILSYSPLAPAIPLQHAGQNQYLMIREYKELAIQNFKMLLYTSPGERIMDSNFGVGLRRYLFELHDYSIKERLSERIESQVREYMPYIRITSITYPNLEDSNILSVKIKFDITTLNIQEEIQIEQESL